MKLATWNVNSLNVRLAQVITWLQESQVDVLCLQELKQESHKFDEQRFLDIGYHAVWTGQKTYNGVAIVSKHPLRDVVINNPYFEDPQQRLITATLDYNNQPLRVICAYCPNGSEVGSEKFAYKLAWYEALNQFITEQQKNYQNIAILGDYNIAPEDRDVHDISKHEGKLLVSEAERAAFTTILNMGFHDSFRLFEQEEKLFSWWDYRAAGFRRNAGFRIDHVLLSDTLKDKCIASIIDKGPRKNEQPSDHTPAIAELS